jgi:TrmH family RNA methyltransferase
MGAALRLPLFRGDVTEKIRKFKSAGAVVWGSVAHGQAEAGIEPSQKRILLIGSESHGLSERETALADRLVRIPQHGKGESLNLGVATGILIYNAVTAKSDSSLPQNTKRK